MRKFLLSLGISLLLVHSVYAADGSILKPGHPDKYIVKKGDTLWDIASMFLTDAWMWPDIWHVNPDIKNPDLIYPGDTILLSFVGGKPQLSVQRGEASRTTKLTPVKSRNVKLEPRVRATPLTSAIPAIPLDKIAGLLETGRIVQRDELENAPHIVAGESARLLFGPGDTFYARGNWHGNTTVYGIYRKGQVFQDPETGKILGYQAREVGHAAVKAHDGDLYTLEVTNVMEGGVRVGDRLLPTEERRVESIFYPSAPNRDVKGAVMAVLGDMSQAGRNDVIAINRGEEQGLAVGNVLALQKLGKTVRDPVDNKKVTLPSQRVGLLMLFRTFDSMAYGLILQTDEPIAMGDVVQNP